MDPDAPSRVATTASVRPSVMCQIVPLQKFAHHLDWALACTMLPRRSFMCKVRLPAREQVKLTPGLPAHWGLLKQRLEKVSRPWPLSIS